MASEIRANTLKNRVGLGTVSFTNTGPVVSGILTANTIRLADDNKIQLGDAQDLEIVHDSANGVIRSVNSGGNMHVESKNHIELNVNYNTSSGSKENALKAIANAGVSLFFNGAQKLQTTNTGATVTGTLVATTFSGNVSGGTVAGSTGTFSGNVSIVDKIIHTDDTDTAFRFPSSNTISLETAGAERIRFDPSGSVIINGTTSFSGNTKLQVRGTSSAVSDGGQIFDIASTAVANGGTRLSFGVNEDNYTWIRSYESAVGGRDMVFAASSERLRISASNGFVGINSAIPRTYLQVTKGTSHYNPGNPTAFNSANVLACFENNDNVEVTLLSPNNKKTILNFGDTDNVANSSIEYDHSVNHLLFKVNGGSERLRINNSGAFGVAGQNYGVSRQTIVSNGSNAVPTWSSNPLLLDMDSLGDLDYDGVFLRYREVNVSGNGLVYLGLCKSTTNCPAGRIGCPVGFVPGVVYNSQFRVDKVGITPWPDTSGHRYEYFAVISDYVSAGKLGIFYLTNSTN